MNMKGNGFLKLTSFLVMLLAVQLIRAEGTREILVNNTLTYDSSKRQPSEFYGIQFWDQSDVRRKSGTYQSINAADAIYRIKIRICGNGEVINLGFNQPSNDIFWRLYKPDGTTVQFNDNTVLANGDAGPSLTEQGTAGNPFSYRLQGLYTITNATNANPIVITTSQAHGFANQNVVTINGVVGNTAANGTFKVTVLSATTFSLQTNVALPVNVPGNGAYTSGGNVSGSGFIRTYQEAAVGPKGGEVYTGLPATYAGKAGYRPLQYIADGGAGDYYIAFNPTHADNNVISKRIFSMFDISVWNSIGSKTFQPGRLHCAAWDINCGSTADPSAQFNAKLFFYSKDSVITSVSFNQMRPYGFVVTANSRGVANSGNDVNDRKSTILFNGFPEYPIFLNSPFKSGAGGYQVCGFDPKASFGKVDTVFITGCDNDRCINIKADKSATVGINILPDTTRKNITGATNATPIVITAVGHGLQSGNIVTITGVLGNTAANGTWSVTVLTANTFQLKNQTTLTNVAGNGAYTSGGKVSSSQFTPRILDDQLIPANALTCIPWDGKDGAGNKIVGPLKVTINYYNGLTNLPLFDVEEHRFGYKIDLVAPTAAPGSKPILVYWDDRPVSTIPPLNIQDFTAGKALDGFFDLPSPGSISANNVGNFTNGVAHSTYNLFGCDPSIDNNSTLAGTQGCHLWGARGLNGATATENTFETHNTWWNANVIEKVVNYVPSNIEVYAMKSHAPVPLGSAPFAGTPNDTTVCSNITGIVLNPVVRRENPVGSGTYVAHTGKWTVVTGTGTFLSTGTTTSSTLADTYIPSAADKTSGSVTLRIKSDSTINTPCGTANDTMRILIKPGPDVGAGLDQTVCKSNSIVTLAGTQAGSTTSFQWFASVAGGIFVPNAQTLNATYQAPASITGVAGTSTVTLKLKSLTNSGGITCPADSDDVVITYNAGPVLTITPPAAICSTTNTVALSASIDVGVTTDYNISWTGSGSFTNGTTLTPTYTPTAAEKTAGTASVTLHVTRTTAPTCAEVTASTNISIVNPPTVDAGIDGLFCSNRTDTISLKGTASGTFSSLVWTCSNCAGGGSFNNSANDTTYYDPSVADKALASLTFVLTANSAVCPAAFDQVSVAITQLSSLTLPAGLVCLNDPCATLTAPIPGGTWTSQFGTSSFIPSNTSQTITYCMDQNEITATISQLNYTIPSNGNCLARSATTLIAGNSSSKPFAGNDTSVCQNNPAIQLNNASATAGSNITWSTLTSVGPGVFNDGTISNPTYTLSANEIANGSVTLVITSSENGCAGESDTIIVSVNPPPTVSAGPDHNVCVNNTTVTLNGFVSAGTPTWSVVSGVVGTFSAAGSVNTTFTPSSTPAAGATTTIKLETAVVGCTNVPDQLVITYTAAPVVTITSSTSETRCKASPNVDLTATVANASGVQWVILSGSGLFSPKADSINATYVPSAADLASGTVTVRATSTGNGNCTATNSAATVTITYTNIPNANAGANQTLCENFTTGATITGSFNPVGVSGQNWTSSSGCVSCFADPTALSTVYTPSAADIAAGSVTLTLASTGGPNGCLAVQSQMTISINKAPTVNAGADKVVCTNQNSVSLLGSSTNSSSVVWSIPTGSGSVTPTNTAASTYNISAQDKIDGTVILRLTANGNAGCGPVTDDLVINFTDLATISAGPDRTVCANDLPIQLDGSGASGTWSTATAGSFSPNTTTPNATFQPTSTAPATITFTYQIGATGGCPAVSDQVSFTLIAAPNANATASYSMCTGTASTVAVSAAPSTGTGFWTTAGTGSFANANSNNTTYTPSATDIANGSVNISFETTGNFGVCSADIETAVLTITDFKVSAGPNQNKCAALAGNTFTIPGTATLNGVNSPGLITGWSIAAFGTGSVVGTSTATYTLSAGDLVPANKVITLQISGTSGTCIATDQVDITLEAAPVVTPTPFVGNVCETAASIPVAGAITGAVTSGTWTTSNGGGTFFPNNVFNSAQTTVNYVPVAGDAALASITFVLTADAGLCGNSISNSVSVTLDNSPVVNAGTDDTLCSNNNVYTLAGTISNSAASGTWSSSSGCVACFSASTAFGATTYDADTNDINNGFVTLTLTAAANGTCPGSSDKVIITFSEGPTVSAGLDRTICGNNRTFNIVGSVNAPFTGAWSKPGPLITGFANANNASTTYTALDADTTAGTVDLIFTSVDPAGLCAPDDDTITVTITDAPNVTFASNVLTACSDAFFVSLDANTNLTANPIGLWSGGTGSFVNANASSDTAVYIPSIAERNTANTTGSAIINLKYITASGFCLPDTGTVQITLTAAPLVTITNAPSDSTEICANQTTLAFGATVNAAATGVIWTTSGTGTFNNNISLTPTYTFSALDAAAGTITITATSTGNGTCFSARKQYKVKIQALPIADAGADVTICQDVTSVSLADATIANATGSTWSTSGTGVFGATTSDLNGTYFPSVCCFATLDTAQTSVTLTLTTTGNGLCPADVDTRVISFIKLPTVDAGTNDTICADNLSYALNADTLRASGFTWSSPDGGSFAPSNTSLTASYAPTGVGTFRVVATAAGNGTCGIVRDTVLITVRTTPTISLGLDGNICSVGENTTQQFNVSGLTLTNATGVSWTSSSGGSFDLTDPLSPVYQVSATDISNGTVIITAITNAGIGTCNAVSDQMSISINKAPTANAGPNLQICANATTVTLNGLLTNSVAGSWSSDSLAVIFDDPNNLNATYTFNNGVVNKTIPVVLTAIGQGACSPATDTMLVTYILNPSLSAGSDQSKCFVSNADVLLFQLSSAGVAGTWTANGADPAPTFTPSASTPNAIYTPSVGALTNGNVVTLTFTADAITCFLGTETATVNITLNTTPLLNTAATANICETSATTALSTVLSQGVSGVQWTLIQGFGTISNGSTTNATYNVNTNDKNLTSIMAEVVTTSATCPVDRDTVSFVVDANPIVSAGPDQIVCADLVNVVGAISLHGTMQNTASITWTSGNGTPVTAASLTSTFTATAFPATVTITPAANGSCPGTPDNMVITASATPVVALLTSKDTCAKLSPINLASALDVGNAVYTTAIWSKVPANATGSFVPNATTINGQYIPSAADTARGFVELILTATNTGICTNTYDDTVRFNFDRQPVLNAGSDLTFCAQNTAIIINGASSFGAADGLLWETAGTGNFTPNNTINTVYHVSSLDSLNGGTILMVHSTNGATISCPDDTDFVSLILTPAPVAIVNAGFDQQLCIDNTSAQLSGFILNATGGLWTIVTGSGQLSDSTDLNATYFFSAADKALDTLVLSLQSVGQDQLCQPTFDTIRIIFTPTPIITVAADDEVCASSPLITLGTAISAPSTNQGVWQANGGDGVFSPNEFTIGAQYTPGPNDIANGSVGFTLSSTSNGTCIGAYSADTSTVITPYIQATANASEVMCANSPDMVLNATSSTGTGVWKIVTDDGSVNSINAGGTSALFVPGANDILNQMASVRFVTNGSVCAPDSVQVPIAINPAPTVAVTPDVTVCADVISGGTNVSGAITIASGGIWSTLGTGSFITTSTSAGAIKTVSATYVPSAADTAAGSVVLVLTSIGNLSSGGALCEEEDDSITITIMPEPVVNANANGTCVSTTGIALTGTVSQDPVFYPAAFGQWSSNGSGTFAPDPFSTSAQYVPSPTDITNGSVILTWSSVGAGSCSPNTRSIQLNTAPLPLADAGSDQFTCNNAFVNLNATPYATADTYEWALVGSAPGTSGTGLSVSVNTIGSYQLTLTDRFGCSNTDTVVVNLVNTPVGLSIPPLACYDFYLYVQLTPQPTGLDPQGTFQWSYARTAAATSLVMSGENLDSVRVHSPGIYSLEYTLGACNVAYGSTTVNDVPRVTTPDYIGCSNSFVSATVDLITNTVGPYTFDWFDPSNAAVGTTNNEATPINLPTSTQSGIDTLTYYVTVTDNNGCDIDDSLWVISVPTPRPGLTDSLFQCQGITVNLDGSLMPPGNVDSLRIFNPTYEWYEASTPAVIIDNDTILSTTTTGVYVFRVTVGQCIGDDTTELRFQPYPTKILPTSFTQCFERLDTLQLNAGAGVTGNADLSDLNYDWNGAGTVAADTFQTFTVHKSFFATDIEDLTYTVLMDAIYDTLHCSVRDTVTVHDVCAPRLFPPTAFHPGDPNSEDGFFTIKGKYFTNFKLEIFNRWGEIIFSSRDVNDTWDGTYRGDLMPVGVYAYTISYEGKSEEYTGPFAKAGRIVLIR